MSHQIKYKLCIVFLLFAFSVCAQENDTLQISIYNEIDSVLVDPVETMPEFPGGPIELYNFLQKNLKYPITTSDFVFNGRTIIQFIVEKDGSITNPVVVRSFDPLCDKAALQVIELMPRWKPAMLQGQPIRCKYTLPVTFKHQY